MQTPSPPVRRSIEVEYWVIDAEGRLTEPGSLVDASPGAEREFVEPVLEIKTTPCESSEEIRAELLGRIRDVILRGDELGKKLVPLSTSLNRDHIQDLPSDRTRIQNAAVGDNFQYVRHCVGTHFHFEQQPGCTIDQLNTIIALDPALALVNSSQHFRGRSLAPGARSMLYRWWAYDDLPLQGELWPYVSNREEWMHRLRDCHEHFVARAAEAGVGAERLASCFPSDNPEGSSWTPVKLREVFGTVEWRSPDTALPSQILKLCNTMASIVRHLREVDVRIAEGPGHVGDQEIVLPSFDTVTDHVESAVREGLSSSAVREYLERMGFDVEAYTPLTNDFDDVSSLSVSEARRRRLEYADRLREDVLDTTPVHAD